MRNESNDDDVVANTPQQQQRQHSASAATPLPLSAKLTPRTTTSRTTSASWRRHRMNNNNSSNKKKSASSSTVSLLDLDRLVELVKQTQLNLFGDGSSVASCFPDTMKTTTTTDQTTTDIQVLCLLGRSGAGKTTTLLHWADCDFEAVETDEGSLHLHPTKYPNHDDKDDHHHQALKTFQTHSKLEQATRTLQCYSFHVLVNNHQQNKKTVVVLDGPGGALSVTSSNSMTASSSSSSSTTNSPLSSPPTSFEIQLAQQIGYQMIWERTNNTSNTSATTNIQWTPVLVLAVDSFGSRLEGLRSVLVDLCNSLVLVAATADTASSHEPDFDFSDWAYVFTKANSNNSNSNNGSSSSNWNSRIPKMLKTLLSDVVAVDDDDHPALQACLASLLDDMILKTTLTTTGSTPSSPTTTTTTTTTAGTTDNKTTPSNVTTITENGTATTTAKGGGGVVIVDPLQKKQRQPKSGGKQQQIGLDSLQALLTSLPSSSQNNNNNNSTIKSLFPSSPMATQALEQELQGLVHQIEQAILKSSSASFSSASDNKNSMAVDNNNNNNNEDDEEDVANNNMILITKAEDDLARLFYLEHFLPHIVSPFANQARQFVARQAQQHCVAVEDALNRLKCCCTTSTTTATSTTSNSSNQELDALLQRWKSIKVSLHDLALLDRVSELCQVLSSNRLASVVASFEARLWSSSTNSSSDGGGTNSYPMIVDRKVFSNVPKEDEDDIDIENNSIKSSSNHDLIVNEVQIMSNLCCLFGWKEAVIDLHQFFPPAAEDEMITEEEDDGNNNNNDPTTIAVMAARAAADGAFNEALEAVSRLMDLVLRDTEELVEGFSSSSPSPLSLVSPMASGGAAAAPAARTTTTTVATTQFAELNGYIQFLVHVYSGMSTRISVNADWVMERLDEVKLLFEEITRQHFDRVAEIRKQLQHAIFNVRTQFAKTAKEMTKVLVGNNNHHRATPLDRLEESRAYLFALGQAQERGLLATQNILPTDLNFQKGSDTNPVPDLDDLLLQYLMEVGEVCSARLGGIGNKSDSNDPGSPSSSSGSWNLLPVSIVNEWMDISQALIGTIQICDAVLEWKPALGSSSGSIASGDDDESDAAATSAAAKIDELKERLDVALWWRRFTQVVVPSLTALGVCITWPTMVDLVRLVQKEVLQPVGTAAAATAAGGATGTTTPNLSRATMNQIWKLVRRLGTESNIWTKKTALVGVGGAAGSVAVAAAAASTPSKLRAAAINSPAKSRRRLKTTPQKELSAATATSESAVKNPADSDMGTASP